MIFRRLKQPTLEQEHSQHTAQLIALNRDIGAARQADIVHKTEKTRQRVDQLQTAIDVKLVILTRLGEKIKAQYGKQNSDKAK